MVKASLFIRLVWAALGFVALAVTVRGQSVTAAAPARAASSDETIELSPFVVDTSKDVGYLAGDTLAGTRLNSSLRDTAASVSVLTPEFLADIGAFNLTDAVAYAVNVEMQLDDDRSAVNGNETVNEYQKYRVRGLPASVTRNYFDWNLPTETYNLERVEDSRGPNSVLFGIGSPGGIINSSTKQAILGLAFRRASASYASFDSWRTSVDMNLPLIPKKAGLRFNAVWDQNNSFRQWAGEESRRVHLAGTYALTSKTRLRAEVERGQINDNAPRVYNLDGNPFVWIAAGRPTFPTYVANAALGVARISTTATATPRVTYISNIDQVYTMRGTLLNTGPTANAVITDPAYTDHSINFGGPGQERLGRFTTYSAYLEHQFSKQTALEIGHNHQQLHLESYDPRTGGNTLQGDPNQFLPGPNGDPDRSRPNPEAGKLFLEASWFKVASARKSDTTRATFTTGHDARKWGSYRAAVYGEYSKGWLWNQTDNETWVDAATGLTVFNATPEQGSNYVTRRTYPIERHWATYFVSPPGRFALLQNVRDPVSGRVLNSTWGVPRTRPRETDTTQKASMVALQASYFNQRLLIGGGLRRDEYDEHTYGVFRDPVSRILRIAHPPTAADPTMLPTDNTTVARNKTLGAVLHATRQISLYYNQADNIQLPPRGQDVFTDAGTPGVFEPAPAPKGRGRDFGVGVQLFDGRVYARATYYTTAARGLSTTFNTGSGGTRTNVPDVQQRIMDALLAAKLVGQSEYDLRRDMPSYEKYDQKSSGYEFQLTANPTTRWRVQANYSFTDGVEENKLAEIVAWAAQNEAYLGKLNTAGLTTTQGFTIPQEIANYREGIAEVTESNGIQKLGNRHDKVSVFTRYDLALGRLKGLYVGGGYRFQSKIYTGVDSRGNRVYGNSYWRADALLGYRWRGFEHVRNINVQLNVLNVFDDDVPLVTRYVDLASGPILRHVVQPPRTWRLTTSFDF